MPPEKPSQTLDEKLKTDERARNNFAWHKNPKGGVRGLLFSAEKVRELVEKKYRKNYWKIGALAGGGITAIAAGIFYFAWPEHEIIEKEVPVPYVSDGSTHFMAVSSYNGVDLMLYNNTPSRDIKKILDKLCFTASYDDKIECRVKKCVKYEQKQKRKYYQETNKTIFELDNKCVEEELITLLRVDNLLDIVGVRVEFNENLVPRFVLKVRTIHEPQLIIGENEKRVFEETIIKLKKERLWELSTELLYTMKEGESTPSEQSNSIENYLKWWIYALEEQFNLDFGEIKGPGLTEKAEIKFRYAVSVKPWKKGYVYNTTLKKESCDCSYANERLIDVTIYIKGFLPEQEKTITIHPSNFSNLTNTTGAGFLIKEIGENRMKDLECEQVHLLSFSSLFDALKKPIIYTCTKTFLTLETNIEEKIITYNPSLTIEENTRLMKQMADLFRTNIESYFWSYKEGYTSKKPYRPMVMPKMLKIK